jgi:hypothetical protein
MMLANMVLPFCGSCGLLRNGTNAPAGLVDTRGIAAQSDRGLGTTTPRHRERPQRAAPSEQSPVTEWVSFDAASTNSPLRCPPAEAEACEDFVADNPHLRPTRPKFGLRPQLTGAELVTLVVPQALGKVHVHGAAGVSLIP